jgi:hypothetical protein
LPKLQAVDIETVVADLKQVMARRSGSWPETLGSASRLLQLPRYRAADDAIPLLAADIEAAIARLPEALQRNATVLLNTSGEWGLKRNVWDALGVGESSSTAKRLTWTNVFTHIAVELLKLFDEQAGVRLGVEQPSFRVLHLHVHASERFDEKMIRTVSMTWQIKPTVSDLRHFYFYHPSPEPLAFLRFTGGTDDEGSMAAGRIEHGDFGEEAHWYVLILRHPLPIDVPTTVDTSIQWTYLPGARVQQHLDYNISRIPIEGLSFSLETLFRAKEHVCVAIDRATNEVARRYEPTDTENEGSHFEIPSPQADMTYRVSWGSL